MSTQCKAKLSSAETLKRQIRIFGQQQDHCKDEFDSCMDACNEFQRKF